MKSLAELKSQSDKLFAMMDRFGGAVQISPDAILCVAAESGDLATDGVNFDCDTDTLLITGLRDGNIEVLNVNQNNKYHLMQVIVSVEEGYACHKAVTTIDHDAILADIDAGSTFRDEQIALQAAEELASQEVATGCICCGCRDAAETGFDPVAAEKMRELMDGEDSYVIDARAERKKNMAYDLAANVKSMLHAANVGVLLGQVAKSNGPAAAGSTAQLMDGPVLDVVSAEASGALWTEFDYSPTAKSMQELLGLCHDAQQADFEDGFNLCLDDVDEEDDEDDAVDIDSELDRYLEEQFSLDTLERQLHNSY